MLPLMALLRALPSLQVGAALQHQGLDVRRQPEVGRGGHRVVALAGILDHGIAGIIDEIDVIPRATQHPSGAGPPYSESLPVLP